MSGLSAPQAQPEQTDREKAEQARLDSIRSQIFDAEADYAILRKNANAERYSINEAIKELTWRQEQVEDVKKDKESVDKQLKEVSAELAEAKKTIGEANDIKEQQAKAWEDIVATREAHAVEVADREKNDKLRADNLLKRESDLDDREKGITDREKKFAEKVEKLQSIVSLLGGE